MGAETGSLRRFFDRVRGEARTALLPFMMAGLPDRDGSVSIFASMADAGADAFEVGFPYSDPLMDGPVIQAGAAAALRGGADLEGSFEVLRRVAALGKPTLAMTYANPVLRYGPAPFCERVAAAGADGLIVADLPVEEAGPFLDGARQAGIGLVLFVAPTSDDARLARVAAAGPAFIYGVAEMGVTGERTESSDRAVALAQRVRAVTNLPLVLGVGISSVQQARALAGEADGIIVGSALVRRVLEGISLDEAREAVRSTVMELAAALRRPSALG